MSTRRLQSSLRLLGALLVVPALAAVPSPARALEKLLLQLNIQKQS